MSDTAATETAENPNADFTTGADATMDVMASIARERGFELPQGATGLLTIAQGEASAEGAADAPDAPADGDAPADTPPAPAAAKPEEQPEDSREMMRRLAAKDAKYQAARNEIAQLRQQMQQYAAVFEDMRANPLQGLHKHFGLTTTDLNKRALDLDAPGEKPAGDAEMPSWAKQLQQQNQEMARQLQQYQEREQQAQQQQARQSEVQKVQTFLGQTPDAFPVISDLGRADLVYERVLAHVGQHGKFESDREAAEVVTHYAQQVEQQLRSELLGYAAKPAVKQWLLRELGAKNEAKPARQEIRAPNGSRIGAAPAVPNGLTTQRATKGGQSFADLPYEEQLRRTAELAVTRQAG